MCAGPRFEYHWQDGVTYKKPAKFSAPGPSSARSPTPDAR